MRRGFHLLLADGLWPSPFLTVSCDEKTYELWQLFHWLIYAYLPPKNNLDFILPLKQAESVVFIEVFLFFSLILCAKIILSLTKHCNYIDWKWIHDQNFIILFWKYFFIYSFLEKNYS